MAILALTVSIAMGAEPVPDPRAQFETPERQARRYFALGEWGKLEALIERVTATGEPNEDGRFQSHVLTLALGQHFERWGAERDDEHRQLLRDYRSQRPDSAFEPIVAAIQVHATGWRARGHGFTSTVTPEGWALFRERVTTAWNMMLAAKAKSSRLPIWYERALSMGLDAEVPMAELTAIFNEGINRFPGHHPLYFSYLRQFSPRWGGDYDEADAFILSQVTAQTNPDGDVLYTRLYWSLDQYGGSSPDFFADSRVSWPRMRAGFELLMKQFPKSARNQAFFLAFACRARDASTYAQWRPAVDANEFRNATPEGLSLEICDARFTKKV
jgi:hypothetical protein